MQRPTMSGSKYLLYGAGQLGVMLVARFFFQWLIRFCDVGRGHGCRRAPVSKPGRRTLLRLSRLRCHRGSPRWCLRDAWVRKGKERRNLLWFSFALPAVGLALIFAPTAEMSAALRWLLLGAGMFVFFVGYTLYAIPYWALVEGLRWRR